MKTPTHSALALLASVSIAGAAVRLPAIFSDHMVLQREAKVLVWGFADAGEEVTVSIAGQKQSTRAGADGKWRVQFDELKADGPQEMTVKGTNELTVKDVLIGEVWLASGQSNMALTVSRAKDYDTEKAAATTPDIRQFLVTSGASPIAKDDCIGKWTVCSPETVGGFSAAAYFFVRDLHRVLKVPFGIVHSSVGGTPIESWIAADAQHAVPELKGFFEDQGKAEAAINLDAQKVKFEKDLAEWPEKVKLAKAEGKPIPVKPRDPVTLRQRKGDVGGLFNGKIAPLVGYAIRGALWYQGEANTNGFKAAYYQYQLPLLVTDWRKLWGYEFPFAWVQLPNFVRAGEGWPLVREAMLKTLSVPKTGMAITIDIGEPGNIHPKDKQDVGARLAAWALGTVYGTKVPSTSGPLPAGHEVKDGSIVLHFTHADGGLVAKGGALTGFTVASDDKVWHDAEARIEGGDVVVSSAEVPHPVAARYAWKDNPVCNLYNGAGIPASPFRTDDWAVPLDQTLDRRAAALKARGDRSKKNPSQPK